MSDRRARLVILLVLFHVGLAAAATVLSIDVASAPSYFDDGDFLPRLLAEQMPAVLDPAADWVPALILLAAVAAAASRAGSPVTAAHVRVRAPPRP
jgi:hypothetical protein